MGLPSRCLVVDISKERIPKLPVQISNCSFISGVGDTDTSVNKKLKYQSQIPTDFMFTKAQRNALLQTIIHAEHFMQAQLSIDEFMTNCAVILYIIT